MRVWKKGLGILLAGGVIIHSLGIGFPVGNNVSRTAQAASGKVLTISPGEGDYDFKKPLPKVKELNVYEVTIKNPDFKKLPALEVINASSMGLLVSGSKDLTKLNGLKNLKKINICNAGPNSLSVSNCPNLQSVSFMAVGSFSLSKCPKVKTVSVGEIGLKSIKIKSCPGIETLDIGAYAKKAKISPGDIYACKKLKKLKAPKEIINKLDRSKLPKTVKIQTAS